MFGRWCLLLLADQFGTGVFTGGEVKQLTVATREWNPVMNDPPTIFFTNVHTVLDFAPNCNLGCWCRLDRERERGWNHLMMLMKINI
jgi:hypothetical protein